MTQPPDELGTLLVVAPIALWFLWFELTRPPLRWAVIVLGGAIAAGGLYWI